MLKLQHFMMKTLIRYWSKERKNVLSEGESLMYFVETEMHLALSFCVMIIMMNKLQLSYMCIYVIAQNDINRNCTGTSYIVNE